MDRTASKNAKYRYIYGPVPSWRLGSSLGVDPISQRSKECSFDCVYCQLGRTKKRVKKRKVFVPSEVVAAEIKRLPSVKIDHITFSGRGEPTLAKNLGEMIEKVKKIRKEPIAVLTNSSMLCRKEVRRALSGADLVVAKLDAPSEELFRKINGPAAGIYLKDIIKSIKDFKAGYKGKLALQIMFIEENGPSPISLPYKIFTCACARDFTSLNRPDAMNTFAYSPASLSPIGARHAGVRAVEGRGDSSSFLSCSFTSLYFSTILIEAPFSLLSRGPSLRTPCEAQ